MIYRQKRYYHGAWFKYPSRLSCCDVFVKSCMDLFVNKLRHFVVILHYCDVIKGTMASQITSLTIAYSTVYSSANQRKHQSSASLALCGEFTGDRWFPAQRAVTRKLFSFDDVCRIPDIFKCIFFNGNCSYLIQILRKHVLSGLIYDNSASFRWWLRPVNSTKYHLYENWSALFRHVYPPFYYDD